MNGYSTQIGIITFNGDGAKSAFVQHHVTEARKAGRILVWCSGYVRVHLSR